MFFALCVQLCNVSHVFNHSDSNAWLSGEVVVFKAS